jgi:hypothetical protein
MVISLVLADPAFGFFVLILDAPLSRPRNCFLLTQYSVQHKRTSIDSWFYILNAHVGFGSGVCLDGNIFVFEPRFLFLSFNYTIIFGHTQDVRISFLFKRNRRTVEIKEFWRYPWVEIEMQGH